MQISSSLLLLFTLSAGAPAPQAAQESRIESAPAGPIQDDEIPDKREDVKELIATLAGHVKKRGAEDREAIETIDKLLKEYEECGPKDRSSIVKGLDKCFAAKRKDLEDGVPNNRLYLACAVALGDMGPESCKVLTSWIDHKRFRKDLELQRRLVLALGKTKDDKAVETLADLLVHRDVVVVGAAAEALGNYADKPSAMRKDIFEELLKVALSTKNATDADRNDTIARERWDAVSAPLITTLQKVSGQKLRSPNDFRDWWNDNKRRDWDKE